MNKGKILSSVLAGTMSFTMIAAPVLAATDADAVIDMSRTGTINIHKLVENDGANTAGYGLVNPDESRIPVNNIGYGYLKIADIENIRGIVVSKDGDIDLGADNGEVSVGAYYVATPALDLLIDELGIVPDAIYIKTEIREDGDPDVYPTIQYDWKDQNAADFLADEQAAVNVAEIDLAAKKSALTAARNERISVSLDKDRSASDKAKAQQAYNDAVAAQAAAESAKGLAQAAYDAAAEALQEANGEVDALQGDFDAAFADFEEALADYDTNDDSTLKLLEEARQEFLDASNSLKSANENRIKAQQAFDDAEEAFNKASDALDAAQFILEQAQEAFDRADLGDPDTIDGTTNALKYAQEQLENAQAYYDAVEERFNDASDALDDARGDLADAQEAFNTAQSNLETATSNNATAYATFKDALDEMNRIGKLLADAIEHQSEAEATCDEAADALASAEAALAAANTALQEATDALNAATGSANSDADALADADAALATANADYEASLAAYKDAVEALDTAAAKGGIMKAYSVDTLEALMKQVLATIDEGSINNFISANAQPENIGYTDDNGVVSFSGLPLGLYMVAEVDFSYHDGIAGAWNDKAEGGSINNDQLNYYDRAGGTYYITPLDAHDQEVVHEYAFGQIYRESVNPEWPVIESQSAPFLVSVPTTNAIDTTEEDVAAGDNYGTAGTVWQYTIDVYPKNQTTAIFKRIIDPDESDGNETLRTSEDYQIGDLIEQIIWAEAPSLQPNYFNADGTDITVEAANQHLGYVISDTMTSGLTFDKVTKVTVIPAAQIKGANDKEVSYIYYNPEGGRCTAEEALVDPSHPIESALKTITKYYDAEGHEVTREVYEKASALNIGDYYSRTLSYKKVIQQGNSYTMAQPTNVNAFDIIRDGSIDEGIELIAGTDYVVVNTDDDEVRLTDYSGAESVVVSKGTHGFAVVLTPAGLAKLNARPTNSIVCVYFDSILNKDAKIGQTPENMNFPTLSWVNSNTWSAGGGAFRQIHGNEVFDYTYELVIRKEGVQDATNVKFVVSRDDAGDINQVAEKDLTDSDSQIINFNQDDSIRFVQEAPGVYHVWGFLDGENSDEGDAADAFETTTVNGVVYNTVTPASDGMLRIKGLDSNDYIFKEIQTEAGKNLLKDTFKVQLRAEDDEDDSLRDGRLKSAMVSTGSSTPIGITIGAIGADASDSMGDVRNLGIASMAVTNYNVVDLRTGGAGTTIVYICGIALLAAMGTGAIVVGKKKKKEENAEA